MADLYKTDIDSQKDLTRTLLGVFRDWNIEEKDQFALLGLPQDNKPRLLNRFRAGMEVPNSPQFLQRAHYILSICNAVYSLFPHNVTAANYWVTTPSYHFGDKSPLEVMVAHGLDGMEYILNLLNGEENWGNGGVGE